MPEAETLGYFDHVPVKVADTAVTLSRTGYTGDLGFELTVPEDRAVDVLDAVLEAGRGHGIRPFGEEALMTLRIEAGLALIDIEWHDARLAMSDADTVTPKELGFGWMLRGVRDGSRRFVGSEAIRRELLDGTSRWATTGIVVDWADWDRLYRDDDLFPPKSPHPLPYESMLYHQSGDDDRNEVGYCTSFVYSPVLQRHIGIARVRPGPRRRPAPSCGSSWPSTTTTPRSGSPRPRCRSSTLREEEGMSLPRVRRDRRRRRPQRAHPRGVPREGGAAHPGAGEERRRRRRGDHRGAGAGLPVHDVLLRAEPAAARDHPRARPGRSTASCR